MKTAPRTWFVVGDSARARIFVQETSVGSAPVDRTIHGRVLETLEHPEARGTVRDSVTDRAGRVRQIGSPGKVAALAAPTDPKDVVATAFARVLAKRIEKGRVDHEFDRVVLVAPPRFLGILGKVLGTETEKCVVDRIDKDLTPLSDDEVRARLDL